MGECFQNIEKSNLCPHYHQWTRFMHELRYHLKRCRGWNINFRYCDHPTINNQRRNDGAWDICKMSQIVGINQGFICCSNETKGQGAVTWFNKDSKIITSSMKGGKKGTYYFICWVQMFRKGVKSHQGRKWGSK